jgi:undecaprenyl-diphosphatase
MINTRWLLVGLSLVVLTIIYVLIWLILKFGPRFYRVIKSLIISAGLGLRQNEYVAPLLDRHTTITSFTKRRLDHDSFWGWPATVLGLAFLYVFCAFLGLIEDFITSDPIVAADARFNQLMVLFRSEYFVKIFLFITCLGRWQIVLSAALALSLIWWLYKKQRYIVAAWLALAGSTLVNTLSKLAFHRARPPYPVYIEPSFSFPSGHATIAVAFYGFIIYFLFRSLKKIIPRTLILLSGLSLILAIGFSRLYLSVHYLSDVWAWLILAISLVEWRFAAHKQPRASLADKVSRGYRRLIALALIFAELTFFIYTASHYNPTTPKMAAATPVLINQALDLPADFTWPRFSETITAAKQEPLSFIVAARTDSAFIADMNQAGWIKADPINDESLGRLIAAAFNTADPAAPLTPSFWNGEVNTYGLEKSTQLHSVRQRHHARFWKTNIQTRDGLTIYVGTASLDTGLKWGITHKIDPAIDLEREQLFQDLAGAQVIQEFHKTAFVPPTLGKNFTGDEFFTDGQVYVLILQ